MSTITRPASSYTDSPASAGFEGPLTNPGNVYADDGAYADATMFDAPAPFGNDYGGFGFDTDIGQYAIIDGVSGTIKHKTSTSKKVTYEMTTVISGASATYKYVNDAEIAWTTSTVDLNANRAELQRQWLYSDFGNSAFQLRLDIAPSGASGGNAKIDYMTVSVAYHNLYPGAGNSSGAASVSADAMVIHYSTGTAGGTASVSANGILDRFGAGTSTGSAAVSGDGRVIHYSAGTAGGTASVGASALLIHLSTGASSGAASTSGNAYLTRTGAGNSAGSASVFANAIVIHLSSGTAGGTASVSAEGVLGRFGSGASSGTASVTATMLYYNYGNGFSSGISTTSGDGVVTQAMGGSGFGEASVFADGLLYHFPSGYSGGSASTYAESLQYTFGGGTSTGVGSTYAGGALARFGSGLSTGIASVSADASVAYVWFGTGSSSGAASVSADSIKYTNGSGVSTGIASVYAESRKVEYGAGSGTGISSVYANGYIVQLGAGSAFGQSSGWADGSIEADPIHFSWPNHWTDPTNLLTTDSLPAVVTLPANQGSHLVRIRDYQIQYNEIPDTAAVSGIELTLHGCWANNQVDNCTVYAYLSLTPTGASGTQVSVPIYWTLNQQSVTIGSNLEMWGFDGTPASAFRSSGFSAHVWLFNNWQGTAVFNIDSASLTLYYNYFGG